jgi:autotransporter-associated beta strand protein
MAPFLTRACKVALLPAVVLFGLIIAPGASAQTLELNFPFSDAPGVSTADTVVDAVVNMTNSTLAPADLHGVVGSGPGGLGRSLDFTTDDGATTANTVPGSSSSAIAADWNDSKINLGTVSTYTVAFWFRNAAVFGSGDSPLLFELGGGSNPQSSFAVDGANTIGFAENTSGNPEFWGGTTTAPNPVASGSLSTNIWYFYALTYDGSNLRVYVGTPTVAISNVNTIASSSAAISFGTSGTMIFGNRGSDHSRNFPGWLAHFQFYNGVASQSFLDNLRQTEVPNPLVTATTISPSSTAIGALVAISATTGGTQPITNQWFFVSGGVTNAIPGATNTTYYIQSAQVNNSGSYFMVAGNSLGTATNAPATLVVGSLAGAGMQISDVGNIAPVPGINDISQPYTNGEATGGSGEDGLNYFSDNSPAPGQTFTTGSNPNGYVVNGVYVRTAGLNSGSGGTTTAQPYTLRLYTVSGSTATLLSTYVTTNSLAFPDGDWVLYSGAFTNVLQPNTTYAYSYHENTGYDEMAYDTTNPYAGGEMCLIPTAGGAITYCSSGNSDATFDIGLSTTPSTPVITQQPASQTVVVGQPVSFSVGVEASSPTYQWYTSSDTSYSNPSQISGATSSTYSIASPTINNATNYFVVIDGSVTSAVATLTVRLSVNTLAWLGTSSFNWDLTTGNWSNILTQAASFVYQTGDNVQFTDAGKASSPISLTTALSPTSVTDTSSNTYILAGTGNLAGNVQLTQNGSGVLLISNVNTFQGSVAVNNGILRLANASALGNQANAVNVNGGTLDVNGIFAPSSLQYNIQGSGNTNEGAINNSSANNVQNGNGIRGVNLTGNATVGAVGRWDLNGDGGGTGLQGNNFNLTKVGTGSVFFIDAGTNNQLGNITIASGALGFQGSNNLGNAADNMIIDSGAALEFFATAQGVPLVKNSIIMSNADLSNGGTNLLLNAPLTLLGTNTIEAGFEETVNISDTFAGPITGTGGLVIDSVQNYIFEGTNTYSGETIVNGNDTLLTVEANSSLGNSSFIQLGNANAIIDVSSTPGLMLSSGQTLSGIGSLFGNVSNNTGSVLSPGIGSPGTLTLASGNLTLAGATVPIQLGSDPTQVGNGVNSLVSVAGNLTLNGLSTIQISAVGSLSSSQPYTVLSYGGGLSGTAANLQVSGSNSRYTISLVDPTTTPGSVEVSVTGIAANLIWRGGNASGPNIWNQSIKNFFNTGTSGSDQFFNGDNVVFDDTGLTNIVDVTQTNIPGSLTFNNNAINYTFNGPGNLEGALSQQGTASVTLAISNTPALTGITNDAGTLVFELPVNATITAPISDNGAGLGSIIQAGTNILTLGDVNSSYSGTITVTNGVLRYTNSVALGASTYLYATNNGTLDINDVALGTKNIAIAGNGYLGQGALANLTTTFPAYPYQLVQNITLVGNATIAANARWDLTNTIAGNDFDLTKEGTSQITLIGLGGSPTTTGIGNVNVFNGNLTFQQNIDMGDPNKACLVESNAVLGFWAGVNPFVKTNVVLLSGSITSGGGANMLQSTLTLDPGTNFLAVSADLYVIGPIVGTGGFTENGGANLWLEGTNTYSGPTTVGGNSTMVVEAGTSIGASSYIDVNGGSTLNIENTSAFNLSTAPSTIEIDGGGTLNVATPSSFNLGSGQSFVGNGTVLGNNINFGSGSTLAVGFAGSTYTLTMAGNLNLEAGSTDDVTVNKTTSIANDKVVGLTNVTMGGVLVITNIGNAFAGGDAIPLFSATNYSGSFSSIIPATPGPGLAWNTATMHTDGTLRVVSTAGPHIASVSISGTNVVLSGTGGVANSGYSVLTQTNLLQPISNWILLGTNTFNSSGNFLFVTNGITPGTAARYYLIRVP